MPVPYDQLRTHTNDPYPASPAGGSKQYNRSDLLPIPSIQGTPLYSLQPHAMGDQDETYTGPSMDELQAENKSTPLIDPVRTMIGGISGLLGGAASSPIRRAISGTKPVFDWKDMVLHGGVGAGTVGAASTARQILSKILRG